MFFAAIYADVTNPGLTSFPLVVVVVIVDVVVVILVVVVDVVGVTSVGEDRY